MYIFNLPTLFKKIAFQYKEQPALLSEEETLLYAELDVLSDKIASFLIQNDIKHENVICIEGKKTTYTYALIIACLKTGATYSIFDPESPIDRLEKIFNQCEPKAVICFTEKIARTLYAKKLRIFTISDILSVIHDIEEPYEKNFSFTGNTPAYIMFTSGSTGFPKGAVMTHHNVLNLIHWSKETFQFKPSDILTNINPLFFDNSVFDIYSALFTGATLAIFPKSTVSQPYQLLTLIDEWKCTSWFSVPSLFIYLQTLRAFTPQRLNFMKRIIFGGEGYPKSKLKELYDLYKDRVSFYNVYGPTECTCICSCYKVSDNDFKDLKGFLPLGNLIPNFDFLILNDNLQKIPKGKIGELFLRGPNVGRGYYNDSIRTSENFIQNPYCKQYIDLIYRTGDLVYINPKDSKIYICGRKDNQIKHMGYRIELEEIENVISCIKGVDQCAVIYITNEQYSKIIAFIATKQNFTQKNFQQSLKNLLPLYMIPSQIIFVDALPTNPNGKIDRKKLKTIYKKTYHG